MTVRILVVDDAVTVRRLVEAELRDAGFAVETSGDGADALARTEGGAFDLVVVDEILPRMSGADVVRGLRARAVTAATPIVWTSPRAEALSASVVDSLGAAASLAKPFSGRALRDAVADALARPRRPAEVPVVAAAPPQREPESSTPMSGPRAARIARWAGGPEASRDRFAALLVEHLGAAVREVLEAGVAAHDDLLFHAFRHHVTPTVAADLAREIRAMDPSLRGATGFEGTLGVVSLADVLRLANASGLAGVLRAERSARGGAVGVEIALRPGLVDQVVGAGVGAEYRLGRYLVSGDALGRGDLDAFIASGSARGQPLGRALVAARRVEPDDLAAALRAQTLELFAEASRWLGGRFRFVPGETLAVGDAALAIAAEECVQTAAARSAEWEALDAVVSLDQAVSGRDASLSASMSDVVARRVVSAVDGERTGREIARELGLGPLEVARALASLLRARAVAVARGPSAGI